MTLGARLSRKGLRPDGFGKAVPFVERVDEAVGQDPQTRKYAAQPQQDRLLGHDRTVFRHLRRNAHDLRSDHVAERPAETIVRAVTLDEFGRRVSAAPWHLRQLPSSRRIGRLTNSTGP